MASRLHPCQFFAYFSWPSVAKSSVVIGALVAVGLPAWAYQYPVRIEKQPRGTAAVDLLLINEGAAPVNVVIELTHSKNAGFSPAVIGSKFPHMVKPGETKRVTTAVPLLIGKESRFAYRTRRAFGDAYAEPKLDYLYRLPMADNLRGVARPYSGFLITNNLVDTTNAVEVLLPVGSQVVAARDGVVIDARGLSGDPDNALPSPIGNYLSIYHDDGSWATYGWLQDDSINVKPGDGVKAGDPIAKSGSNPDAVDTYLLFTINRNYFGLSLRSLPIRLVTAGGTEFDVQSYSGPVSPNLQPKYKVPDLREDPWVPPETLLPPPKVPVDWNDEHLNPAQRQLLFRQRREQAAKELNADTISGSQPLIMLAVGGALLAVLGIVLAFSTDSEPDESKGVRGRVWGLLRGRTKEKLQPMESGPPSNQVTYMPSSAGVGGMLSTPMAPEEKPPPEGAELSEPSEASAPVKTLDISDRGRLHKMLMKSLPDWVLCSANVSLGDFVTDERCKDVAGSVDFLLVDETDGSPVAAVLLLDSSATDSHRIVKALSFAGVPTISFETLPKERELLGRLKRIGLGPDAESAAA